jgi:hypothetical protein
LARRERLEAFVAHVAREFGVPSPGVVTKRIWDVCQCAGYYDYRTGTIYIDDAFIRLDTVLHELAHHIQYVVFKEVFDSVERGKPHCNRRFEAEAKAFESFYKEYYEGLWRRLVEGVG